MSLSTSPERSHVFTHFIAVMISVISVTITIMLSTMLLQDTSLYLLPIAGVAISAWYGGTAPGISTSLLSVALINLFLIEPRYTLSVSLASFLHAGIFLFVAGLIVWTDAYRRRTAHALKIARDELQIILDNVADGITVQTEDGQPVFANTAAATLLGYQTPADLTADTHQGRAQRYTMLDENNQPVPMSQRPRSTVFRTGAPVAMSFQVQFHTTGATHWIHLKSSPVFDYRHRAKVVVNVLQDITTAKQHEHELARITEFAEESRQRLNRLISHVPGMVYDGVLHPETGAQRLTFVSPYSETLFGYSAEQLRGDDGIWEKIIHPDDRHRLLDDVKTQIKTGDSVRAGFRAIRADGSIIHCEASFTLTRDKDNQPVGTAGVIIDVTERKESEAALLQYAQELQRSNEELEQFAYVASHDLQEPLRMVTSYLQLLDQRYTGKLDADAQEFIGFAVDGASRMKTLINDLLSYSRVQRTKLVMSKVSFDAIFAQAKSNLQLAIEDAGAVVTSDPLPTLTGNEGQLIQVFQNLLGNALKFKREIPPTIHVSAQQADDEWVFSIKDNGIGIDERYLQRIFVIFQRLHGRDQYPGTGIGLAICKKIIERHNGRIWVESTAGSGTTFYFSIPVTMKKVFDGTR